MHRAAHRVHRAAQAQGADAAALTLEQIGRYEALAVSGYRDSADNVAGHWVGDSA